jgi:hypothetical protein
MGLRTSLAVRDPKIQNMAKALRPLQDGVTKGTIHPGTAACAPCWVDFWAGDVGN